MASIIKRPALPTNIAIVAVAVIASLLLGTGALSPLDGYGAQDPVIFSIFAAGAICALVGVVMMIRKNKRHRGMALVISGLSIMIGAYFAWLTAFRVTW